MSYFLWICLCMIEILLINKFKGIIIFMLTLFLFKFLHLQFWHLNYFIKRENINIYTSYNNCASFISILLWWCFCSWLLISITIKHDFDWIYYSHFVINTIIIYSFIFWIFQYYFHTIILCVKFKCPCCFPTERPMSLSFMKRCETKEFYFSVIVSHNLFKIPRISASNFCHNPFQCRKHSIILSISKYIDIQSRLLKA